MGGNMKTRKPILREEYLSRIRLISVILHDFPIRLSLSFSAILLSRFLSFPPPTQFIQSGVLENHHHGASEESRQFSSRSTKHLDTEPWMRAPASDNCIPVMGPKPDYKHQAIRTKSAKNRSVFDNLLLLSVYFLKSCSLVTCRRTVERSRVAERAVAARPSDKQVGRPPFRPRERDGCSTRPDFSKQELNEASEQARSRASDQRTVRPRLSYHRAMSAFMAGSLDIGDAGSEAGDAENARSRSGNNDCSPTEWRLPPLGQEVFGVQGESSLLVSSFIIGFTQFSINLHFVQKQFDSVSSWRVFFAPRSWPSLLMAYVRSVGVRLACDGHLCLVFLRNKQNYGCWQQIERLREIAQSAKWVPINASMVRRTEFSGGLQPVRRPVACLLACLVGRSVRRSVPTLRLWTKKVVLR